MAPGFIDKIYSLFTTSSNELLIGFLLWLVIFIIIFEIIHRSVKFPRNISFIIALVISIMGVYSGITTKAMHFVISLTSISIILIFLIPIIIVFIFFMLKHFGIGKAKK